MKPYKSSTFILGNTSIKSNQTITFSFNLSSSIHPDSFIKENNLKESAKDSNKMIFEDITRNYSILYADWSSEFTPIGVASTTFTLTKKIIIDSELYTDFKSLDKQNYEAIMLLYPTPKDQSEANKTQYTTDRYKNLKNRHLKNFFIRLEPRDFVSGNVYEWKGEAESTVENYMGIVKVLNLSRQILVENPTRDSMWNKNLEKCVDLRLNWDCSVY